MNKIIGITGQMSSGKTTLVSKLMKLTKEYEYLNVDDFRRKIKELEEIKPYIYRDEKMMKKYKRILYEKLTKYLKKFKGALIVEWALIVEDQLLDLFDKIIIVEASYKEIRQRLQNADLSAKQIKMRLDLQMKTFDKIKYLSEKEYLVVKSDTSLVEILDFMKGYKKNGM